MTKKLTALTLCLLLLAQMMPPSARAAEDIYFVAAHNEVQPVTDDTMPFWDGGYLYIPASVFSHSDPDRKLLGLTFTYIESEQAGLLYRDAQQYLQFDLEEGYTLDQHGQVLYPGAIVRNGQFFISAYQIARHFDLIYSVTDVPQGHLVWLREENFGLTDRDFANAAAYMISQYYTAYLKTKPADTPAPPSGPKDPPADPPTPDVPTTPVIEKDFYLCLEAGSETDAMLEALEQHEGQAAFFCSPDFLEKQGDLLRRMVALGHSVALIADGAHPTLSVEEQLAQGNALLLQATFSATRLVRLVNGSAADEEAVTAAGFRLLDNALDQSAYAMQSSANARMLLQYLNQQSDPAVVWLGSSANAAGLRAFLTLSLLEGGHCRAWSEVT